MAFRYYENRIKFCEINVMIMLYGSVKVKYRVGEDVLF